MHTASRQTKENIRGKYYFQGSKTWVCLCLHASAASSYLSTLRDVFPLLRSQIRSGVDRFLLTWIFNSGAIFAQIQLHLCIHVNAGVETSMLVWQLKRKFTFQEDSRCNTLQNPAQWLACSHWSLRCTNSLLYQQFKRLCGDDSTEYRHYLKKSRFWSHR